MLMFYAVRNGKDLHIRVRFYPFMGTMGAALLVLVLGAWGCYSIGFKRESFQLRVHLRQAIGGSIADSMDEIMLKHAVRMTELGACRAEVQQAKAVNKDLAKMLQKTPNNMGIGGTP
jgi:hypothetical protein